jgi:hypothetical protein
MTEFNYLLIYNKLALSDEDNTLVSNTLKDGCKIVEKEINEKNHGRFKLNIDYLLLEKGEPGLKTLFEKIDTYNDLFFIQSHSVASYNPKILVHLSDKDLFFLHGFSDSVLKNEIERGMINFSATGWDIKSASINHFIENCFHKNLYYLHNGNRNSDKVIEKYNNLKGFQSFLFEGATEPISDEQTQYIKTKVTKVFSKLKEDELIILDVGLKYLREIFSFLEINECKNKVVSLYGDLEGRFKKLPFELIRCGGGMQAFSLSLATSDLISKIHKSGLTEREERLLNGSIYRLDRAYFIAEALAKCSNEDLKNKNKDAITSAILSFDGENDIFKGNRQSFAFDKKGNNIYANSLMYTYPNSLQVEDYITPSILYKYQFTSDQKKLSTIYPYIDIERVSRVTIQTGVWTAEFYIDLVSNVKDPMNEIIFNNLSTENDKFEYKLIFEKKENDNFSTKRYHVSANFDFLPLADNFPFDWQNIFISLTIKDKDKHIMQPIPNDLIDKNFDIAEWELIDSFSGIKYKKNKLFKGTNLEKSVDVSQENRIGWILKRKNTATLLKIGIPLFFLIFLVYYSTFIDYEVAHRSIGILTTTFLSAIALYFSVEKPEPKKMTIVDLIFVWFYLINGATIVTYGLTSFFSPYIFNMAALVLKVAIPLSLFGLTYHLYKRIQKNRESILLDRDI